MSVGGVVQCAWGVMVLNWLFSREEYLASPLHSESQLLGSLLKVLKVNKKSPLGEAQGAESCLHSSLPDSHN